MAVRPISLMGAFLLLLVVLVLFFILGPLALVLLVLVGIFLFYGLVGESQTPSVSG